MRPSPQLGLLEALRPPNWAGGSSRRAFTGLAIPFWFGQAEEAVANLPLRLAVRVRCGIQACAQHDGTHARVLKAALH